MVCWVARCIGQHSRHNQSEIARFDERSGPARQLRGWFASSHRWTLILLRQCPRRAEGLWRCQNEQHRELRSKCRDTKTCITCSSKGELSPSSSSGDLIIALHFFRKDIDSRCHLQQDKICSWRFLTISIHKWIFEGRLVMYSHVLQQTQIKLWNWQWGNICNGQSQESEQTITNQILDCVDGDHGFFGTKMAWNANRKLLKEIGILAQLLFGRSEEVPFWKHANFKLLGLRVCWHKHIFRLFLGQTL